MLRVLAVGNRVRGDDAVAFHVAEALRTGLAPELEIVESNAELSQLVELLDTPLPVVLIDASQALGSPGRLRSFELSAGTALPARFGRHSTHAMGVAEAIALADALGTRTTRLLVLAIEGARFDPGEALSAELQAALPSIIEQILQILAQQRLNPNESP